MLKITHFIIGAALSVLLFTLATLAALIYRYPLGYREIIETQACKNSLDPALVAAVVWTESGFDPSARSPKGAMGLMQLLPSTAEWLVTDSGKEFAESDLYDPVINIALGTQYLKYLLDKFGNESLAVAAYNAGEGNVARWQAEKRAEIPFPETRAYLSRVRTAKNIYAARLKPPAVRT